MLKASIGTQNAKLLKAQSKAADAAILDVVVNTLREPDADNEWFNLQAQEATEPMSQSETLAEE